MGPTLWSGTMLILATSLAFAVRWLGSRRQSLARMGGAALATVVVTCCGVIIFALIADNLDELRQIRMTGLLAIVLFTLTSAATAVGWIWGVRLRVG